MKNISSVFVLFIFLSGCGLSVEEEYIVENCKLIAYKRPMKGNSYDHANIYDCNGVRHYIESYKF